MREWFANLAGPDYAGAVFITLAALAGLVLVLLIVRLIQKMTFGTYVAGGRNRKTRLAVMDATAIDGQRRLVLVRRDDVEHLLLIGGAADVVVERDIRIAGHARRPSLTAEANQPANPPRPRVAEPAPPRQPAAQSDGAHPMAAQPLAARPAPAQPAPVGRTVAVAPQPMPTPISTPPSTANGSHATIQHRPAAQAAVQARPVKPAPQPEETDEALIRELQVSLDENPVHKLTAKPSISLDDEMTRLLGELSSHRKK